MSQYPRLPIVLIILFGIIVYCGAALNWGKPAEPQSVASSTYEAIIKAMEEKLEEIEGKLRVAEINSHKICEPAPPPVCPVPLPTPKPKNLKHYKPKTCPIHK